MTGDDVTTLRKSLGMTRHSFASVIGVTAKQIGEWESLGTDDACPRNVELLAVMAEEATRSDARVMGIRLLKAVDDRGGLYALHRLLDIHYATTIAGSPR